MNGSARDTSDEAIKRAFEDVREGLAPPGYNGSLKIDPRVPDAATRLDENIKEQAEAEEREEANEPLPLTQPEGVRYAYPVGQLGPVLGPAAQAIADIVQCPDSMAANTVLGVAALCNQGHANVVIDGRAMPINLFLMTIAESGDRKSAADKVASKMVIEHERGQDRGHGREMKKHRNELDVYEEKRSSIMTELRKGGKNQGAGDIATNKLNDLGDPPEPPKSPAILCQEPTLEGLQKSFKGSQLSKGLFSDEGGQFFGGHAMNSDNAMKTACGLSKFWDGADIVRTRAGEGESCRIEGARLSAHFMMQPIVANKVLSDPIMREQGFNSRFLIAAPISLAGGRLHTGKNANDDKRIQDYSAAVKDRISKKLPVNNDGAPTPRELTLSADAMAVWVDCYNEIEGKLKREGDYADIRAMASKAGENLARVAANIELFSNSDADEISENTMVMAWPIMAWYLNEALRVTGAAAVDVELMRAQELLDWLHEKGHIVTAVAHIIQKSPRSVEARTKADAEKYIRVLEAHRWLSPIDGATKVDGKRRNNCYQVTPNPTLAKL